MITLKSAIYPLNKMDILLKIKNIFFSIFSFQVRDEVEVWPKAEDGVNYEDCVGGEWSGVECL